MTSTTKTTSRILVTGASGQLGSEMMRRAQRFNLDAEGFVSSQLDITDARAVRQAVLQSSAGVVVNAAAYTAVDKAESEKERAFAVNRDGTYNLAAACSEADIPLVHVSTDYVPHGCTVYSETISSKPCCASLVSATV